MRVRRLGWRDATVLVAIMALPQACAVPIEDGDGTATGSEALTTHAGTIRWTNGDGVNVRAEPHTGSRVVDWLPEGARIQIACQSVGETILGDAYWDYLPAHGGYIADAFADTGFRDAIPGVRACGDEGPPDDGAGDVAIRVRGVVLEGNPRRAIQRIARDIVGALPGSREEQLDQAAYVAWWALKEGVLDLDDPLSYSNCGYPSDHRIGPLEVCGHPDYAWQVGIGGVQAAWRSAASVDSIARWVHPGLTTSEILARAATAAGHPPGTYTGDAIVASDGRLRLSWLLREGAVGFAAQYPVVVNECFSECRNGWERTCAWCFGSGWDRSAQFASSQGTARSAIAELREVLDRLSSRSGGG